MTNSPPSKRADRHGESRNQNQPLRVPQKRAWTQRTTPCHLKTSYQPSPAGPLSLFPFRDLTRLPSPVRAGRSRFSVSPSAQLSSRSRRPMPAACCGPPVWLSVALFLGCIPRRLVRLFFSFSSLAVVVGRLVNRHDHVGERECRCRPDLIAPGPTAPSQARGVPSSGLEDGS